MGEVIVVTSGNGGVCKTTITANIGVRQRFVQKTATRQLLPYMSRCRSSLM